MKNFLLFAVLVSLPLHGADLSDLIYTTTDGKVTITDCVTGASGIVKLKLKSGKVFEVPANKLSKKDNEFISSLAKPEGVNGDELEFREHIAYLKGSDTPYTGKVFILHENGQKTEANLKDGKRDGLFVEWHENGQKKSEVNYKDDKKVGLATTWHENGQKKFEGNFKDGKFEGLSVNWHENGQKKAEANWKNGKKDGLQLGWYKNGQKEAEANYKDGKPNGLWVTWYENGQKWWEQNWKDGKLDESSMKYWNSKGEPVATTKKPESNPR